MTMSIDATMPMGSSVDDGPAKGQGAHPVGQWLDPCDIQLDVDLHNRRQALEVVATAIWRMHGLDQESVLRALWRRELVGSTAIGCGVAIPHARIEGIAQPAVLYLRAKTPIDFAAPDGKPVRHLLAIVVPGNGDPEAHLHLLAAVASMVTERAFRERLAAAEDPREIRRAFAEFARIAAA
jgi:PTS system nitrogen regulatory IIA component